MHVLEDHVFDRMKTLRCGLGMYGEQGNILSRVDILAVFPPPGERIYKDCLKNRVEISLQPDIFFGGGEKNQNRAEKEECN